MNTGSCQCGSIRYEISSVPFDCCYCHCSICRKLTGSSSGSYGSIPLSDFIWVSGEELLTKYRQNRQCSRFFCSNCGSYLASTHKLEPENIFISLGCLNETKDIEIKYQQFVGSKAAWAGLDSSIENHQEWPEGVWEKKGKDA